MPHPYAIHAYSILSTLAKLFWRGIYWLWSKIWGFLSHREMPLGISLLLFAATAGLTYSFTPKLNQTFEQQKIVSGFVTENLSDFNISCRELISNISILIYDMQEGKPANRDLKNKIRSQITDLQWRAVQLDVIFENDKSASVILAYKESLTTLGEAIENARTRKDTDQIAMSAIVFTDKSVKVIDALARKAGLKIDASIDTALLEQTRPN